MVTSGSPSVAGGGSSGGAVEGGGSSGGVVAAGGSSEGVEPEWWVTSSAEVGTGLDNTGRGVSPWEVIRYEERRRLRRTNGGLILEGTEEIIFIIILLLGCGWGGHCGVWCADLKSLCVELRYQCCDPWGVEGLDDKSLVGLEAIVVVDLSD